ncbi:hypothetical protein [Pseudomonas sp. BIC9C]|uniref:hypothetical protein n=1 Tax=Pseudomonas sp. BIC9C TaxID=3078458 RepID=UPI002AD23682|nr:hypothetical protein [Pseudomonas sp. BIC9C]
MALSVSNFGAHMDRKFGVIGRQPASCFDHGEYSAVILKGGNLSGCPKCASNKRDMQELERKRCQFRIVQQSCARIPKRFAEKTFADFVVSNPAQQIALDACTDYVDNFRSIAVKVAACCCWGRSVLARPTWPLPRPVT